MLNGDELGEKGESRFRELCADAGLICNPATRDRAGWDFLVEFPNTDARFPLDKRPAPVSCHIQVKTTAGESTRIRARLSTLERIAKDLKPAFIVLLTVSDDLTFSSIKLLHLFDGALARVLKRLRKLSSASGRSASNTYVTFSSDSFSQLSDFSGLVLAESILSAVGPRMDLYLLKKRIQLQNLGYKSGRIQMKFAKDDHRHAGALRGEKGIGSSPEFFETRFGVSLPLPALPEGLSFARTSNAETYLSLLAPGENVLSLPAFMFTPIDEHSTSSFTIRTSICDLEIVNDSFRFNNWLDRNEKHTVQEWIDEIEFKSLLLVKGATLSLHVPGQAIQLTEPLQRRTAKLDPGFIRSFYATRQILALAGIPNHRIGIDDPFTVQHAIDDFIGVFHEGIKGMYQLPDSDVFADVAGPPGSQRNFAHLHLLQLGDKRFGIYYAGTVRLGGRASRRIWSSVAVGARSVLAFDSWEDIRVRFRDLVNASLADIVTLRQDDKWMRLAPPFDWDEKVAPSE